MSSFFPRGELPAEVSVRPGGKAGLEGDHHQLGAVVGVRLAAGPAGMVLHARLPPAGLLGSTQPADDGIALPPAYAPRGSAAPRRG